MEIARAFNAYTGIVVRQPIDGFLALSHCGEASNIPANTGGFHSHPIHEFVYIMRGISSLEIDNRVLMVEPGEMTVTYPGERHAVNRKTSAKNQFLWVGLDLPKLGEAGAQVAVQLEQKRIRILKEAYELEPALRGLLRQLVRRGAGFERVARAHVQLIVALLGQLAQTAAEQKSARRRRKPAPAASHALDDEPTFTSQRAYGPEVNKIIDLMYRSLDRRLANKEMAEVAGWSEPYLYPRFRREVGVTPHAYHLTLRLDAAKDALTHPEMPIIHVAQIFGFSSSQHFSMAFARSFGMSPSAWRARQSSGG